MNVEVIFEPEMVWIRAEKSRGGNLKRKVPIRLKVLDGTLLQLNNSNTVV